MHDDSDIWTRADFQAAWDQGWYFTTRPSPHIDTTSMLPTPENIAKAQAACQAAAERGDKTALKALRLVLGGRVGGA